MVVDEVGRFGQREVETGGFLLAEPGSAMVIKIAFAGDVGIVRRRRLFEISAMAIEKLFVFADEQHLGIPVQFHSHELGNWLSPTDEEHGFCVEGFTSVVVPQFHEPTEDVADWGWWRFCKGRWEPCAPAMVQPGTVECFHFDEQGVWND